MRVKSPHKLLAKFCDCRTAMRISTPHSFDQRGIESLLQRGNQEPRALIAHPHLASGSAYGTKLTNRFQKAYLTNADGLVGNKPFGTDSRWSRFCALKFNHHNTNLADMFSWT